MKARKILSADATELSSRDAAQDAVTRESGADEILGCRPVFRDAKTGAAVFYVPRFVDPGETFAALEREIVYLPRDDPTVTMPARRGGKTSLPRDQA